jgi:hypothetical protein
MSPSRRTIILICVVLAIVFGAVLLVKHFSETALSVRTLFEKTGTVARITFVIPSYTQPGLSDAPSLTCIEFEDADALTLLGVLSFEEGKTYHIVYSEHHEYGRGEQWSGKYYVAESVEEISP